MFVKVGTNNLYKWRLLVLGKNLYLKKEPLFLLTFLQCYLPVTFKGTYCKDFRVSIQVLFYR